MPESPPLPRFAPCPRPNPAPRPAPLPASLPASRPLFSSPLLVPSSRPRFSSPPLVPAPRPASRPPPLPTQQQPNLSVPRHYHLSGPAGVPAGSCASETRCRTNPGRSPGFLRSPPVSVIAAGLSDRRRSQSRKRNARPPCGLRGGLPPARRPRRLGRRPWVLLTTQGPTGPLLQVFFSCPYLFMVLLLTTQGPTQNSKPNESQSEATRIRPRRRAVWGAGLGFRARWRRGTRIQSGPAPQAGLDGPKAGTPPARPSARQLALGLPRIRPRRRAAWGAGLGFCRHPRQDSTGPQRRAGTPGRHPGWRCGTRNHSRGRPAPAALPWEP